MFDQPTKPSAGPAPAQQPKPIAPAGQPTSPQSQPARPAVLRPVVKPVEDIFAQTDAAYGRGPARPGQTGAPNIVSEEKSLFGGRKMNWRMMALIAAIAAVVIIVVIGVVWALTQLFSRAPAKTVTNQAPTNTNVQTPAPNQPANVVTPPTPPAPPANQPVLPADSDSDGLTDVEERALGTNPYLVDTDNDGLTDRAEVKIYRTDPLNPDTDGDGYLDGQEVINGYDPLKPGTARLFEVPK